MIALIGILFFTLESQKIAAIGFSFSPRSLLNSALSHCTRFLQDQRHDLDLSTSAFRPLSGAHAILNLTCFHFLHAGFLPHYQAFVEENLDPRLIVIMVFGASQPYSQTESKFVLNIQGFRFCEIYEDFHTVFGIPRAVSFVFCYQCPSQLQFQ